MKDVIVVGAALIGLATAKALADQGLKVLLVDQCQPKAWDESEYALRVSAISLASQAFFEDLNIWDAICAKRVGPYDHMFVWDAVTDSKIEFDAAEIAENHLGHIIENDVITASLWDVVVNHPNIEFKEARPQSLQFLGEHWVLELADERISTHLVLACDGANSWVRETVGIKTDRTFYDQKGIVAVVRSEKPHQKTAYQRFLPSGPLAFLPLDQSNLSSIVWSMETEKADEYLAKPKEELLTLLEQDFEHKLGKLAFESDVAAFPLAHHHAPHYVMDGLALVGDAAHGIHPLAGQGANLGFADVAELSRVIDEARQKGRRYYTQTTLQKYERARRRDNEIMRQSMTGFNALFSNEKPSLIGLRGAGLQLVNSQSWLKNLFVRQAV